jgi:tRNA(fMet)-specific endonuclease VapC
MLLVDTNILIDYLRDVNKAKAFIERYGKTNLAISTVIAMELYQGCLNRHEFATLRKELIGFNEIALNETIGKVALQLSQQFALSHKMGIPDTLIAATALVYDLEVRTYNIKDFRFIPGIKVSNLLE